MGIDFRLVFGDYRAFPAMRLVGALPDGIRGRR